MLHGYCLVVFGGWDKENKYPYMFSTGIGFFPDNFAPSLAASTEVEPGYPMR